MKKPKQIPTIPSKQTEKTPRKIPSTAKIILPKMNNPQTPQPAQQPTTENLFFSLSKDNPPTD